MKARTPIMAFNKTSLQGQLHSSGPKGIKGGNVVILVDTLLLLQRLDL